MMRRASVATLTFACAFFVEGPLEGRRAGQDRQAGHDHQQAAEPSQELWVNPMDLETRDLFRGQADGPPPPAENGRFEFVKKDTSGRSPGYDVRDAAGVVWSVKLGPEAQSEVVSSRLLWAIGFHQPPTLVRQQLDAPWQPRGGTPERRALPAGSR